MHVLPESWIRACFARYGFDSCREWYYWIQVAGRWAYHFAFLWWCLHINRRIVARRLSLTSWRK